MNQTNTNTMRPTTLRTARLVTLGALALGAAVLPACRGDRSEKPPRQFLPDMDDSPKWKPQTNSDFYADGRAMRQPVPGTVPFGTSTDAADHGRATFLKDDVVFATGKTGKPTPKDPMGDVVENVPEAAIKAFMAHGAADDEAGRKSAVLAMLARGEERFNIYCAPCHGFDGKGKGTVGVRMVTPPANLHRGMYRDRKTALGADGHIFDVIRNGWNNGSMPGYAHALSEKDSWAIVTYVRALQELTIGQTQPEDVTPAPAAAPAQPAKGGNN